MSSASRMPSMASVWGQLSGRMNSWPLCGAEGGRGGEEGVEEGGREGVGEGGGGEGGGREGATADTGPVVLGGGANCGVLGTDR